MQQSIASVYYDEVNERTLVARTSRKRRVSRVGWCTSPMDVIDRRRDPAYRTSRVRIYHISDLKVQNA